MDADRTFGADVPDWFTPSGDTGQTRFGGHGEVAKDDARLIAYGDAAEANATIGLAIAVGQLPIEVNALLTSIQNDMLDLAADLFVPLDAPEPAEARISDAYIQRIERAILHYAQDVGEPDTRVLPGGTAASALLYLSRNSLRRAERALWHAVEEYPHAVNPTTARYVNRLATLFLLLARAANAEHGNIDWVPGASARALETDGEPPSA